MAFLLGAWGTASSRAAAVEPVLPGKTWERKTPSQVDLDEATLAEFARQCGGRGCVVRYGCFVYTWGEYTKAARQVSCVGLLATA